MKYFKAFSDWLKRFFGVQKDGNDSEKVKDNPTPSGVDNEESERDETNAEEEKQEAKQNAVETEPTPSVDDEENGGEQNETKPEEKPETQNAVEPQPTLPVDDDNGSEQNEANAEKEKQEAQNAVESEPTPTVVDHEENDGDSKIQARNQGTNKSRNSRGNVNEPRNIGGRRGTSLEPPKSSEKERKQTEYAPAAELVCRERGRIWEVALLIPPERSAASVELNGTPLEPVDGNYPISSCSGAVSVKYEDGKEETIEMGGNGSPMFFKMGGNWSGKGVCIRGPRCGYIVALAPSEWTRIGDSSIDQEPCAVDGYSANFFYIGDDENPAGFEEFPFQSAEGGFELNGAKIHDDSDDGDLYIGDEPPTIEADDNIVCLRVGPEDGERDSGWKGSNFKPAEKTLSDILNGRERGRFYVRAYVKGSIRAVDSDQFRYCKDLREIQVNGERYTGGALITPGGEGHMPVKLEFIGKEGARIRLRLKGGNGYAQAQADGSVFIEPNKQRDETVWILGEGANEVEIGIHLPRVWWKLDGGGWTDKPISMTRQEFYEKRESKLTVSLPYFVEDVHAGFNGDLNRKIPVVKEKEEGRPRAFKHGKARFPLLNFVDYSEIAKPLPADALLQIRCSDHAIDLIRVAKDEPKKKLDNPDRCVQHMIRRNDGFSRRELQGADLSRDDALRLGCRVDRRRKSCHQHNIDFLKQKERVRDASTACDRDVGRENP